MNMTHCKQYLTERERKRKKVISSQKSCFVYYWTGINIRKNKRLSNQQKEHLALLFFANFPFQVCLLVHPWKTSSTATIFTAISKVSWRQEKLVICTEFPLRCQNDTSLQFHFQFDEDKEVTGNQISWVEQVVTLLPFQCTVSRQWRYVPMGHSQHFPKKLFSSRDKNKK